MSDANERWAESWPEHRCASCGGTGLECTFHVGPAPNIKCKTCGGSGRAHSGAPYALSNKPPTSHKAPRVGSDVRSGDTKQMMREWLAERTDEELAELRVSLHCLTSRHINAADHARAVELRDAWRDEMQWGMTPSPMLRRAVLAILDAYGLRLEGE